MNYPSSTIQASGLTGAGVSLLIIAMAIFAPTYYARLPPGTEATLVTVLSTVAGYFKHESVLNIKRKLE